MSLGLGDALVAKLPPQVVPNRCQTVQKVVICYQIRKRAPKSPLATTV